MKNPPAIIITYNPIQDLSNHLDTLYQQFDQIILVDNGSEAEIQNTIKQQVQERGKKLETILNRHNLGIATALNQGFSKARELGFEFVVTLDQDSLPSFGMKDALMKAWQNHSNQENLAVLGSIIIEEILTRPLKFIRSKNRLFFERVTCNNETLRNITFVITSGSLYSLNHYRKIGPFRDDFFIDFVDIEYCLRAISLGHEVSVACNARLIHNLGNRQKKSFLGSIHYPTLHAPLRWYYISRNRIVMLRNYASQFPHWFFLELGMSIKSLAKILLLEDQRWLKIKAIFFGTRDGLMRSMGEASKKTQEKLLVH